MERNGKQMLYHKVETTCRAAIAIAAAVVIACAGMPLMGTGQTQKVLTLQ